jgi:hypothetical protein
VCYLYVIVTIVNLLILLYIFGKFYVLFEYTFLLLRTFVTCRGLHFGGEFSTMEFSAQTLKPLVQLCY